MAITDSREKIISKRGYRKDISGDQYDLYLSSYPVAANYLMERLAGRGKVVAELCCGVGVTLETLAKVFNHLIGVELDANALAHCRKNLEREGVLNKVTLINGDVSDEVLLRNIKADLVIYDIPYWVSLKLPDGTDILEKNPNFETLVVKIKELITEDIVVFAPPWFEYPLAERVFGKCEFQKIYINGRYDRNYIFSGNLVNQEGVAEKQLRY
jgi:predicted RNA methylase